MKIKRDAQFSEHFHLNYLMKWSPHFTNRNKKHVKCNRNCSDLHHVIRTSSWSYELNIWNVGQVRTNGSTVHARSHTYGRHRRQQCVEIIRAVRSAQKNHARKFLKKFSKKTKELNNENRVWNGQKTSNQSVVKFVRVLFVVQFFFGWVFVDCFCFHRFRCACLCWYT